MHHWLQLAELDFLFTLRKYEKTRYVVPYGFNEIYGNETFLIEITSYLNSVNNFWRTSAKARM